MKKIPPDKYKEIYSQVTRLVVEAIIKTPEGIILTKRAIEPYKGKWHIPGGTVLMGERVENALKRVVKEEVGLDVETDKMLGIIEYTKTSENGGYGWTVGLAFLVFVIGGKISKDAQSNDVKVFKELPKDMIDEQYKFIKEKLILL